MKLSEITIKHVVKARRNASRPALGAGKPLPITHSRFTDKKTGYSY